MNPISALLAGQAVDNLGKFLKAVAQKDSTPEPAQGAEPTTTAELESDFETQLRSLLTPDAANKVNEEELFAALLEQRIGVLKGPEAASQFAAYFAQNKAELTMPNGYVWVEPAAEKALQQMQSSQALTAAESADIHRQAFQSAQLDDDHTTLYDGRGGPNDPTIALMDIDNALLLARLKIEALEGETPSLKSQDLTGATMAAEPVLPGEAEVIEPQGHSFDGAGSGFLFKPESEHQNKLVILLPAQLENQVLSVILKDQEGNTIEEGVSSGYANPDEYGPREHFRFSRTGGDYPPNLVVEIALADGSIKQYIIPDPEQRYD